MLFQQLMMAAVGDGYTTRMVKKSIGIDFRKTKSVSITAALIVDRYHPKALRNLRSRLHPENAETTGPNR